MKRVLSGFIAIALLAGFTSPVASGWIGIYAMIERVELSPNDSVPDRIRVWGAFAFVDGTADYPAATSVVRRGQLYFALPAGATTSNELGTAVRREWADLKSVAGSEAAVGFGAWRYFGTFGNFDPADPSTGPTILMPSTSVVIRGSELRVHPDTAHPQLPTAYAINTGVVKLMPAGSHAKVVALLRQALGK